jgi:hypothetical protein
MIRETTGTHGTLAVGTPGTHGTSGERQGPNERERRTGIIAATPGSRAT